MSSFFALITNSKDHRKCYIFSFCMILSNRDAVYQNILKLVAVRRKFISLRVIWSTSGYNSKQCLVNFKTDKFLKITFLQIGIYSPLKNTTNKPFMCVEAGYFGVTKKLSIMGHYQHASWHITMVLSPGKNICKIKTCFHWAKNVQWVYFIHHNRSSFCHGWQYITTHFCSKNLVILKYPLFS